MKKQTLIDVCRVDACDSLAVAALAGFDADENVSPGVEGRQRADHGVDPSQQCVRSQNPLLARQGRIGVEALGLDRRVSPVSSIGDSARAHLLEHLDLVADGQGRPLILGLGQRGQISVELCGLHHIPPYTLGFEC